MFYNIFTGSMETGAPDELACTDEKLLSEAERVSLLLFVMGLGNRIDEDTSLFTSAERKRLEFVQWLLRSRQFAPVRNEECAADRLVE